MMNEEQIRKWIERLPNELMYRNAISRLEQTLAQAADSGTLAAERKRVKELLPKDSVFMDCWDLLHDADMCILQVWEDMELLGLSNTRKLLAAIALRSLGMIEAKEAELRERITSSVKCEAKTPAEPVKPSAPKARKPVTKATFSYIHQATHYVRLTFMYQVLIHRRWLHKDTTNTDFEAIFSGRETDARIRWTGTQQYLYYLIYQLFANEYIEVTGGKGKWEIVLSHFLDKDGHEFPDNFNKQKARINQFLQILMDDTYADNGKLNPLIWLDMTWIDKTVREWCKAKGREAIVKGSTAMDVFRKRASVSAYRIAAICYHLYHKEGREERFARRMTKAIYLYMADYILSSNLDRWGATYERLTKARNEDKQDERDPGLFEECTDTFSRDQLAEIMKRRGMTTKPRQFIYLWKRDKLILEVQKDIYKKIHKKA